MAHCQTPSDRGFGVISRVYGCVFVFRSVILYLCHGQSVGVINQEALALRNRGNVASGMQVDRTDPQNRLGY